MNTNVSLVCYDIHQITDFILHFHLKSLMDYVLTFLQYRRHLIFVCLPIQFHDMIIDS